MKRLMALACLLLATPTLAQSRYVEAPVVNVEPIVELVTRKVPHEICRDEQVRVVNTSRSHSATPGLLGAVIGGVIGGAAGHDSRYQPVIAGAGALLGASIGTDIAHRQNTGSYYVNERYCGVEYELQDSERVVGYRVGYRYMDDVYYTRTTTPPGNTIRLRVDVSPLP
ncbi:hypothetical protein E4634_06450 [Mangrovimicrobium sediminis]|uniref:Glycine zipper 2TM domain-containing protein n=1 Tax=Mangrovimicrobium sediminis TaxID=2562682 RepID=A0A4Z0M553_9GAMM|nr:hypothetical protein [Haliea sp. SAOS-164]TGD74833.1 hypothetical protein E4634_06450 [Haliea sp. SAOS-164]